MKSSTIILLVIRIVTCVFTCSKKADHVEQVKSSVINHVMESNDNNEDATITAAGMLIMGGLTDYMISQSMSHSNFFLFSIGQLKWMGETKLYTFGILGHVFIIK